MRQPIRRYFSDKIKTLLKKPSVAAPSQTRIKKKSISSPDLFELYQLREENKCQVASRPKRFKLLDKLKRKPDTDLIELKSRVDNLKQEATNYIITLQDRNFDLNMLEESCTNLAERTKALEAITTRITASSKSKRIMSNCAITVSLSITILTCLAILILTLSVPRN